MHSQGLCSEQLFSTDVVETGIERLIVAISKGGARFDQGEASTSPAPLNEPQECINIVCSVYTRPTLTLSTVVDTSSAQRWIRSVLRRCVEVMPYSSKYFSSSCLCSGVKSWGSGREKEEGGGRCEK